MLRKLLLVIVALGVAATCVPLGLWQLRRHDEKLELRATFDARSQASPRNLVELDPTFENDTYRQVTVEGIYLPSKEVVVRGRSLNGRNGNHVLTPLLTNVGAVIVDRGWVPAEFDTAPLTQHAPPTGTVKVSGILLGTESTAGARNGSREQIRALTRPDIRRIAANGPWTWITDMYLAADTAQGSPIPFVPSHPSLGSHLSYAVQWFIFATLAPVVAFLLLRRH